MARRKITEPQTIDDLAKPGSDLPDLTPHQLRFVEGLLAGHTASDAYRAAYDTSNMMVETIWAAASRLRADAKVGAWVDAARCAGFGRASCTFDEHLNELQRLKNLAVKSGNLGAAVQAEQIRGKVAGHHIERIQDVTADSPTETLERIERELGPDIARAIAEQAGFGQSKH